LVMRKKRDSLSPSCISRAIRSLSFSNAGRFCSSTSFLVTLSIASKTQCQMTKVTDVTRANVTMLPTAPPVPRSKNSWRKVSKVQANTPGTIAPSQRLLEWFIVPTWPPSMLQLCVVLLHGIHHEGIRVFFGSAPKRRGRYEITGQRELAKCLKTEMVWDDRRQRRRDQPAEGC